MPILPFLAKAAASIGISKVLESAANNEEAEELLNEAKESYEREVRNFEKCRKKALIPLSKLERARAISYGRYMEPFIANFSFFDNLILFGNVEDHEIQKLDTTTPQKIDFTDTSATQSDGKQVAKKEALALGSGALVSAATYKAVSKKGTTSTGKKISSLTGVASKNATLAWLGGGSKLTGGAGITGGKFVLGGLALAPALVVAGSLFNSKSEENLKNALNTKNKVDHSIARMQETAESIQEASKIALEYSKALQKCETLVFPVFSKIQQIKEKYVSENRTQSRSKIHPKEDRLLNIASDMADIYFLALSTPLLDDNGNLHFEAKENLKQIKKTFPSLRRLKAESEHLSDNGEIVYAHGNKFPWNMFEKILPVVNWCYTILFAFLAFFFVGQGILRFFATLLGSLILFPKIFKAQAFLPQFRVIFMFSRLCIATIIVILATLTL